MVTTVSLNVMVSTPECWSKAAEDSVGFVASAVSEMSEPAVSASLVLSDRSSMTEASRYACGFVMDITLWRSASERAAYVATAPEIAGSVVIPTPPVPWLAPSRMATAPSVVVPSLRTVSLNVRVSTPVPSSKADEDSVGFVVSGVTAMAVVPVGAAMPFSDMSSTKSAVHVMPGVVCPKKVWRWASVSFIVTAAELPDDVTVPCRPTMAVPVLGVAVSATVIADKVTSEDPALTVSLNVSVSTPDCASKAAVDSVGSVVSGVTAMSVVPLVPAMPLSDVSFTKPAVHTRLGVVCPKRVWRWASASFIVTAAELPDDVTVPCRPTMAVPVLGVAVSATVIADKVTSEDPALTVSLNVRVSTPECSSKVCEDSVGFVVSAVSDTCAKMELIDRFRTLVPAVTAPASKCT